MKKKYKIIFLVLFIIFILYLLITSIVPTIVDRQRNQIRVEGPYEVSLESQKLYDSLEFIADMHCDALMWNRNLLKNNSYGQVDIPKMLAANISLQAFTIVTKSPRNQNYDMNTGETDNITALFLVQGRPTSSLLKRAIMQCEDLHEIARKSKGKFRVIMSSDDLERYLEDKSKDGNITAGFLGVEGAHALEGELENVQVLYDNGVRMMSATHFFDNKLGSSAHGVNKQGLTPFGRSVIEKMTSLNMIIDIAHCAPKTVDEIFELATGPVITSHTGVRGTCDTERNLSDEHLQAIAKSGGLVSIAMFEEAVCGTGIEATIEAIKYTADLIGIEHVVLGSDFDGSVVTPVDITGFPLIVQEMKKAGFEDEDIRKVMGENARNFLLKYLP